MNSSLLKAFKYINPEINNEYFYKRTSIEF